MVASRHLPTTLTSLPGGVALKLGQVDGVIGGTIWPAASALCQYLLDNEVVMNQKKDGSAAYPNNTKKRNVIELGSGTGIVGLFYAAATNQQPSQNIILTEHKPPLQSVITSVPYNVDGTFDDEWIETKGNKKSDKVLNLLQKNVNQNWNDLNVSSIVQVAELEWGNENHIQHMLSLKATAEEEDTSSPLGNGFDLILGSDVTYNTHLHDILAETISKLLTKNGESSDYYNGQSLSSVLPSSPLNDVKNDDRLPPHEAKCILSHEERLLNLNGHDVQLISLERALDKVGLDIVHNRPYPITSEHHNKNHNIHILEIQHV